MTTIYNKTSEKEKRRQLRNNMTRAERLLWSQLKGKKISNTRFLRQYGVGSYVIDFYSPQVRLAVEIDGATHSSEDQKEYDTQRQSEIETLGIHFLRFTNQEVYYYLDSVLEKIKAKIHELKNLEF